MRMIFLSSLIIMILKILFRRVVDILKKHVKNNTEFNLYPIKNTKE